MLNKGAIELSLNFLVVIIISIIIFGFGIRFISKLSSQADDLTKVTMSELDQRIGNLVCEGFDRVCIGIDTKTIKRTQFDVFGVKIINLLDSQNFDITVTRPSPSGYTKSKKEIASDNLILNPKARSIFIEKNEEKVIGIGVQVPADAVSGTYIFDVNIQTQDGSQYSRIQKLYVIVP